MKKHDYRQTDMQTDRQIGRQTERHTARQVLAKNIFLISILYKGSDIQKNWIKIQQKMVLLFAGLTHGHDCK
jgi:hypothetical protein